MFPTTRLHVEAAVEQAMTGRFDARPPQVDAPRRL